MPTFTVPPHIWEVILPYLRLPRPKPLSRPVREDLRQPHLCAAATVSQLFNSIIQPLLYGEIVTDSLYHLAVTTCDSDPSSYHRFHFTRRLYLEYWPICRDPTLAKMMERGQEQWQFVGRMPTQMITDSTVLFDGHREVQHLTHGLAQLEKLGGGALFPNLELICIGSLYGERTNRWAKYNKLAFLTPEQNADPVECSRLFGKFLLSAKSLQHICIRELNGPLSLRPASVPSGPNPAPLKRPFLQTIHFPLEAGDLPLPLGTPVRWMSDVPLKRDFTQIIGKVRHRLATLAQGRPGAGTANDEGAAADLEIFCSTAVTTLRPAAGAEAWPAEGEAPRAGQSLPVAPTHQLAVVQQLGAKHQAEFRAASGLKDVISWLPNADMPVCSACGSLPPE